MTQSRTQPTANARRNHILGTTMAVLVAIIWVISSELVQLVFDDSSDFDRPYFVSYVSLSMFFFCLLGFVNPSWRAMLYQPPGRLSDPSATSTEVETLNSPPAPPAPPRVQTSSDGGGDLDEESALQPDSLDSTSVLNARQIFGIALGIAPLFFLSDWIFTVGLEMTSVASSSVIGTLSSLFTLVLGRLMGVEQFSIVKLFASMVVIGGVYIISYVDNKENGTLSLKGDLINVLSALMYAVYTTYLKKKTGPPGSLPVAMLMGFCGALILVGGLPGFVLLHFTGWEKFKLPSPKVALILLINSLIGTVLSDYLWAMSIVLTTPLIGTLALALTVPFAVVYDSLWKKLVFKREYKIGAALVLIGFLMVNLDEIKARRRRQERECVEDGEFDG